MARLTVKISGEDLGTLENNFDMGKGEGVTAMLGDLARYGHEVICIMGGGNIIRGESLAKNGFPNPTVADHMGMLATLQNGLFVSEVLEKAGLEPRLMSKFNAGGLVQPFSYKQATRHLGKGSIVLIAGGTGNPGMTTDTATVVAANELHSPYVIKTTKVDGIYTRDPAKDVDAQRYTRLRYETAVSDRDINVMDNAALAFASDKDLLTAVCLPQAAHIIKLIEGDTEHGTIVRRSGMNELAA